MTDERVHEMRAHWRLSVAALSIATTLGICGASRAWAVAAPSEAITILMSSPTRDTLYANLTSVPLKMGYFSAEGLTVNFANVPGGAAAAQIVASGKADMYFGSGDGVFKTRQLGGDLKMVYVMNNNLQYYPAVAVNSPIKDIAGLKGKKLGVLSLSMGGIPYYRAMLAAGGLDPDKDVTLIAVGQGAQALVALRSGIVDALCEWDVEYAAEENSGIRYRKLLPPNFERDINNGMTSSVVTTDAFIRAHPDAVEKYLRAVAKATVFCLHNEAACVRIHWDVYPDMKPQDADTSAALQNAVHVLDARYAWYDYSRFSGIHRWGDTTDQRIKNTAALLLKNGDINAILPVSDYFTRQFLGFANNFNQAAIAKQAVTYKTQ